MTYCIAVSVNKGLVLAADSRTNSGIDQVNTYRKLQRLVTAPDRCFALLSAGNLATTQEVIHLLSQGLVNSQINLNSVAHMNEAATLVGEALTQVIGRYKTAGQEGQVFNPEATLILAGQIQGYPPGAFMIYPQGNYITTGERTPYLQIGETKYGKPVLDRIIRPTTELEVAARCCLVSMDSTMKSNVSVGPPIDLLIYETDSFNMDRCVSFEDDDNYLRELRSSWNEALSKAFYGLPPVPY